MLGYTSEWGTGRPAFSEFLRTNLIGLSQNSLMATHHAATYPSFTMMVLGGASWYSTQRLIYQRGGHRRGHLGRFSEVGAADRSGAVGVLLYRGGGTASMMWNWERSGGATLNLGGKVGSQAP